MTDIKQSPAAARLLALCLVALAAITASADNAQSNKGALANVANAANVANIANVINAANIAPLVNDGGGFSAFFRAGQLRMLSAFDDALSAQAADVMMRQLPAVKSAGVDFQTKLGGRPGHLGVNVIGAFADDDSRAFGWQLRGYAAQGNNPGLNAGLFYRRIESGEVMLGANAFADYEKDDTGEYLRYSIGAEVVHRTFSFGANYYTPITGDKDMTGGTVAFSRKGYDAKLRVNIPRVDNLKAAADYYNFGGRHNADDDKGYRYGLELQPTPSWQLALFYDDSSKKLGGGISYSRTIGEVKNSAAAGLADIGAAALFAPVWREHSQRITIGKPRPALLPLLDDLNLRLFDAAQQGLTASIMALLAQGANVNAANAFGSTPLHQAAFNGQDDAARLLISLGASINRRQNFGGWAPLHFAASQGRLPMITILIAANANLNLQDAQGGTPLHNAAFNGWHLAASALVSAGADINSRANDGATPLHFAARQSRSAAAARILVSATGVNVNAADDAGWTPLHDAADQGNADIAAILIAARANVNATDNANTSPLDLAIDRGHSAVVQILLAANGRCSLLVPGHNPDCPSGTIAPPPASVSLDISIVGIVTTTMATEAMTTTTTMTAASITTTTTMTAASITTTTTMTAASITTTTTMTAASITTTMSMTTTMATRMASVGFTVLAQVNFNVRATSLFKLLVTLPAPATARPWAYTLTVNLRTALGSPSCPEPGRAICHGRIVETGNSALFRVGNLVSFFDGEREWRLTIVEGSEDIISVAMTTTMTTTMAGEVTETTMTMMGEVSETTMTMMGAITETTMTIDGMATTTTMTILAMTTTTRITTFATTTITLGTNSSMSDIPGGIWNGILPFDNSGKKEHYGGKEHYGYNPPFIGNITNPPPAIALSPSSSFRPRRHSRAHHRHSRAAGAGIS